MILEATSAVLSIGSALSSRRKRKREQERMRNEASLQKRAAFLAEEDIFAEVSAMRDQQELAVEREALAEKAAAESLRQSRMAAEGPDVFLAPVANRSQGRKAFFDEGGVL